MISQDLAPLAAVVPLAGFAGYLRDTLRGVTQPNRVSWALWAASPLIAFGAELAERTGLRVSLVTFVLGFGPAVILGASFRAPDAYWKLGRIDWACAVLACAALAAWVVTRQGDTAIALAVAADATAALPTIRKAWARPESESAGTYLASGAGSGMTLLTIARWQFTECAFPVYVVIVCVVITFLTVRRSCTARVAAAFTAIALPLAAVPWAMLRIAAKLAPREVITPAAVARSPHGSPNAPVTRRERRPATAPRQAPLPPPPHSPAARPPPPRARTPRPSPRPPTTTKPSPSPSRTPAPPRTRSPSPHPPSPTLSVSPPPTPASPSPSPTPTPTYPSPNPPPSPYP